MYDKLKKSHKPYAKKIMYELYPDKICDIDTICSRFVKKRHKLVRASIKDLEKCRLIQITDDCKNKDSEKKYILTREGKALLDAEVDPSFQL
ncbi:hypothetical protein [Clostridium ganghwense]|uniref:MarR family transcriptional regulator n=1 Tax=Clostridium ganghwense TaxID=312089 RepID=A0ABT4CSF2_9CLOT|nr:hypothetical protein [Clostridium ganghwense]MCY6371353.1 hypothetical protein [Clostridium ganghwense]